MQWLDRLADNIAYRLIKWYESRKLRRFLNQREFNVVMAYYDKMWKQEA